MSDPERKPRPDTIAGVPNRRPARHRATPSAAIRLAARSPGRRPRAAARREPSKNVLTCTDDTQARRSSAVVLVERCSRDPRGGHQVCPTGRAPRARCHRVLPRMSAKVSESGLKPGRGYPASRRAGSGHGSKTAPSSSCEPTDLPTRQLGVTFVLEGQAAASGSRAWCGGTGCTARRSPTILPGSWIAKGRRHRPNPADSSLVSPLRRPPSFTGVDDTPGVISG